MRSLPTDMLLFTDKSAARRYFLNIRATLSPEALTEQSRALSEDVLSLDVFKNADTILLFSSTRNEPDLCFLAKESLTRGISVAYPISLTDSYTITFRCISSLDDLKKGAYGILEPDIDAPTPVLTSRSLCIVPALAYDKKGTRLGYGKGYYDKFLSNFPGISVGIAMDSFLCHRLPKDPHDVPLDILITKEGAIYPR